MTSSIALIYCPCPSEDKAKELAKEVLRHNLAACANVMPIASMFHWNGKIEEETECVLLLKTSKEKEQAAKELLEKLHPYDVPCVLSWDAQSNYLFNEWVNKETK